MVIEGAHWEPNVECVCVSFDICQTAIPFHEFLRKAAVNPAGYFRCPFCGGTAWKVREKKG
jgi:hypothetical protein